LAVPTAPASGATLISRQHISSNIYLYNYVLPTGTAQYHQVGVHRVVQEQGGGPISSPTAVFLAHGDYGSFNSDFMAGSTSPQSMPIYLASHGIDVWGIDYGWTLVPLSETDFTFMKDWGLQRDIDDLEAALLFARTVRADTGSDGGRLTLLGFSLSGWTGYALLNEETQLTCPQRQVKSFIPLDALFNTNDRQSRSEACHGEAATLNAYRKGLYEDNTGALNEIGGSLALTDPNGTSPFFPPDTNLQALLIVGAAPWEITTVIPPYGHYVAGTFGPAGINGLPTGLQYTTPSRYASALASSPPYEPQLLEAETNAIVCGNAEPGFDDHLNLITVPVFHVGAGGGEGNLGLYTLTLLGSQDIQHDIVSFYPPDQYALDYGHFDLLAANNAQDVVWSRILQWLQNHPGDNSCSP
jgi:hypothetical protein